MRNGRKQALPIPSDGETVSWAQPLPDRYGRTMPAPWKISIEAYGCALLIACCVWAVAIQLLLAEPAPHTGLLLKLMIFLFSCALMIVFFVVSVAPTFLLTATAIHALNGNLSPTKLIGALALLALAAVASVHLFDYGASDWVDAADPVTGARQGPTPAWYLVAFTAQMSVVAIAVMLRKPIERRAARFARARRRDTLPA